MKTICFSMLVLAACSAAAQQHLNLIDALKLARQNSPTLQAARAEADASSAGARAVRAQTLPQLSANGFGTVGNQTSIISSSPMVEPAALMMTPPGSFIDGNLMLMVPLIVTRLKAMTAAASWQARAAAGELSEAKAELDLRVTDVYFQVLRARRMIASAEARVAAAQELVKNARSRLEAGSGIEANVSRAQSELSAAERELTSARNDEAKAILDLQALIGMDLSQQVVVEEEQPAAQPLSLDDALKLAKQNRGVIAAARARVEAASADVRAAQSQRSPQLYAVAMGDVTNRRDMGGVTAGLTLSFPLFDGGRISAETAQARAMRTRAEAQLREAELTVNKEVRQAVLDLQTAQTNAASAEAAVRSAQAAYDVIALRVQAGKSILVEQLDALQVLTQARADLARATFDVQIAIARLLRAAGGAK
jgi:outer membrane protein TolC